MLVSSVFVSWPGRNWFLGSGVRVNGVAGRKRMVRRKSPEKPLAAEYPGALVVPGFSWTWSTPASDSAVEVVVTPTIPLFDVQTLMERPFFALAQKGLQSLPPYREPGGKRELVLEVQASTALGVATIRDVDLVIYMASHIIARRKDGETAGRVLKIRSRDMLSSTGRDHGGSQYRGLEEALQRLKLTRYTTNIGPDGKQIDSSTFSLIRDWSERSGRLQIEIDPWFAEAVKPKRVLKINADYFKLRPGYERWLYRVARKHAGDQRHGYTIGLDTLYGKSGATSRFARFTFEIRQLVTRNRLPDYELSLMPGRTKGSESLKMTPMRQSRQAGRMDPAPEE